MLPAVPCSGAKFIIYIQLCDDCDGSAGISRSISFSRVACLDQYGDVLKPPSDLLTHRVLEDICNKNVRGHKVIIALTVNHRYVSGGNVRNHSVTRCFFLLY